MDRDVAPKHDKPHRPLPLALFAMIVAIVFEALPYVVVVYNWQSSEMTYVPEYYSAFDLTPFDLTPYGYSNVGPLLAAVLTVLAGILYLLALLTRRRGLTTAGLVTNLIAVAASFLPLIMLGSRYYPMMDLAITLTLIAGAILGIAAKFASRHDQPQQ